MILRKKQRLILISLGLLLLFSAAGLVMTALNENIAFFVTPSDLNDGERDHESFFRLGGLVVEGSIEQLDSGETGFALTDGGAEIKVQYAGILPDLFREGQGIVAQGRLAESGVFVAEEVLAKHDETYMPKEVAEALKEQGFWQED